VSESEEKPSAAQRDWRPAVSYRPAPLGMPRTKRSLPGQLLLWDEVPAPPGPRPDRAVCPHCGGIEFDDDGDCMNCLEPGVGPAGEK
jgi:hypothetical protein